MLAVLAAGALFRLLLWVPTYPAGRLARRFGSRQLRSMFGGYRVEGVAVAADPDRLHAMLQCMQTAPHDVC